MWNTCTSPQQNQVHAYGRKSSNGFLGFPKNLVRSGSYHRFPKIPIGCVINRGKIEEPPEKQQVSMMIDGINQLPAPLFLPKGHYWDVMATFSSATQ